MTSEDIYIRKRILKAGLQSILFYLNRVFPIDSKKIVFTCIEGTTGYSCNPKYIAEELIRQNYENTPNNQYKLIWLVNDTTKKFPKEIKVVRNTLFNRAYQLSTAKFWIDNSRKQLECRKRNGQIYIQTWHAKLGFKPTCLDRGVSFSKIAYLVSKHDSDMVDYWLSNSDWYDKTLKTGSLYEGKTIRSGSPRCDILVKAKEDPVFKQSVKRKICEFYKIKYENIEDVHFMMYAPTFRGGNQGINRKVEVGNHFPDYEMLKKNLENKFGGTWYILLRLHPQLIARNIFVDVQMNYLLDASRIDDMYEFLAGCDSFMTDYSSAAFDAMVMEIPIFLYCDDYKEYEGERGKLLWNLRELPFALAEEDEELKGEIMKIDLNVYLQNVEMLLGNTGMLENGMAAKNVLDFINNVL